MADFPKIELAELALAQYEQITHLNDILWRLCLLTQATALGVENAPGGGESDGDCYIVGASPSGDFATFSEHDFAMLIGGAWVAVTPETGWRCWIQSSYGGLYVFDGVEWLELGSSALG